MTSVRNYRDAILVAAACTVLGSCRDLPDPRIPRDPPKAETPDQTSGVEPNVPAVAPPLLEQESQMGPVARPAIIAVDRATTVSRSVTIANPLACSVILRPMETNCSCITLAKPIGKLKPLADAVMQIQIEKWPQPGVDRISIPWEATDGTAKGTLRVWVVRK